jgi:hypothetical protein
MTDTDFVLITISLGGFAIQRLLVIFTPFIDCCIDKNFPGNNKKMKRSNIKTAINATVGWIVGTIIVWAADISFPQTSNEFLNCPGFIGLIMSGGSEGMNILIKAFDYLKEGRKKVAGLA